MEKTQQTIVTFILLATAFNYGSVADLAPNGDKAFMEYIGASGKPVFIKDVPINNGVDFHFILGFAIDATPDGKHNNGIFTPFWQDTLTPEAITNLKQGNPNVKVLASLGGWSMSTSSENEKILFWYDPANTTQWIQNAFDSISSIITKYSLDGIDIDYESFKPHNNFTSTMGGLIKRLKSEGSAKLVTIAPFTITLPYYVALFHSYGGLIDYVNYQFYTELVNNATAYVNVYHERAKVFGYDKLTASYEVLGRGVQDQAWFDTVSLIKSQANLSGIMIYSADESGPLHYYYEIKSQEMLVS